MKGKANTNGGRMGKYSVRPSVGLWRAFHGHYIIRAKRTAQRKAERFTVGIATHDPDTGKWIAKGDLWSGKRRGGRRITTEHDTMEAAVDALQALADEYPNTVEDAVIFIDDLNQ